MCVVIVTGGAYVEFVSGGLNITSNTFRRNRAGGQGGAVLTDFIRQDQVIVTSPNTFGEGNAANVPDDIVNLNTPLG